MGGSSNKPFFVGEGLDPPFAKRICGDGGGLSVTGSSLKVEPEEKKISLNLQVDESICTMYEYFDIFLGRMMMCRGAAEMLGAKFRLTVNGGKVL